VCLLLASAAGAVWAQTERPSIAVVPIAPVASPTSATETPFPIQVGPPHAVPRGSFVKLRGLPAMAALSAGYSIAPGAWAIPLAALPNLKLTLPAGATGRSNVIVALVAVDGSVLAETRYALVVSAQPVKAAPIQVVPAPSAQPTAPPPAAPPALTAEARERALRLVKKGDQQLGEGGIAQARLLYERAAEAGLAEGAMAMAATYDPVELDRLGVRGMKADAAAARKWYERARQLGAREAEQRLRRLGAN
jgi:TPR repeat protein